MTETYSFPIGTVDSETLTFRESQSRSLSIFEIESNLVYLNNLSLAGGAGSSGVIYKAKSSSLEDPGKLDAADGEFGVQVVGYDDNGVPSHLLLYFNESDLWGNKANFWNQFVDETDSTTMLRGESPGEIVLPGDETQGLCSNGCYVCGITIGVPNGTWVLCCCDDDKYELNYIRESSGYYHGARSSNPPNTSPKPKKIIRFSRIAGSTAPEDTFTFTIDQVFRDIEKGGVTGIVITKGPGESGGSGAGEGNVTYGCTGVWCYCPLGWWSYQKFYPNQIFTCCAWYQRCTTVCANCCANPANCGSGSSWFSFQPDPIPQQNLQSESPCPSCAKNKTSTQGALVDAQTTETSSRNFWEGGVAYRISIVDSSPTEYNQSLSTSVNNGLIYTGENQIYPAIDATPSSGYSSTAFTHGGFNSALTKFTSFTSSYTFSSSFTASVNGTTSWPKFGLTSSQFDYKSIMIPHPSSGISSVGRYYYQLAIDRTHPNGSFNSMLTNLDAGYRVNLNFQLASASIVSPTYSGPKNFSTVLHDYFTLTGNIVNVIMSSTFSLPSLVRNSRATMSYNGTRIFTAGNKFQLSFNEFSTPTTSTYSTLENSFWQPLLQSTSDKVLTIQQVGASNYWKFRISGSSSKVKTKSRAIAQGKNAFEYILSDAYLLPSNIYRPGVLSKLPNTFPSHVQYNISYSDFINPGNGQFNFELRESSLFATASTFSVYLTEPLEEGEIVVKRVVMSYSLPQISGSQSTPNTQFSSIEHSQSVGVPKTVSQTYVAFKPTLGGKNMDWYNQLERNFMALGVTSSTNPDGSITMITNGKPQLITLNINNCPPCPDGQTLDFYFGSITKLVTGEIIIGNYWFEYSYDNGIEHCDCSAWMFEYLGFKQLYFNSCTCRQNPNLS